jgi:hypothetical protein
MRRFALLLAVAFPFISTSAAAQSCAGFTDVLASSPYCPDVTWIAQYGVTKGCAPSQFCPNQNVTRLQMAAFMHRLGENPSFVNGGNAFGATAVLGTSDNQSLTILTNNQPTLRLIPATDSVDINTVTVINGSPLNTMAPIVVAGTIAGGGGTNGGTDYVNQVTGSYGTVGGGLGNTAGPESTVGGGYLNIAKFYGTVAGGSRNNASGAFAVVGGGGGNTASAGSSTVPGGADNVASGNYSFAAGQRAKATTDGSFIWADTQAFDFGPSVSNFFGVRATGGVGLTIAIDPTTGAVTQFCNLLPPIASWSCTSDRDAKENFIPADGKDILQRLVAMPLFSWNFKGADPTIRSLGPTAQDFYGAFALGRNDKSIANVNLEGVALAAVQGLNAKVDEQTTLLQSRLERAVQTIQDQQREIAELSERVQKAETLAADVVALKAALAELQRERETVAIK